MTPKEAVRRLKKDSHDAEAIKSLLGNYEGYIGALYNQYKSGIAGMDLGDVKQELQLKMLKQVPEVKMAMSDAQLDSYFKTVLRNRIIRFTRQSETERKKLKSIDEPIFTSKEGEEFTLEDVLEDTLSHGTIQILENEDMITRLMSKISPRAQRIVQLILEGDGQVKKIKEELASDPEYRSSKGTIKRILKQEIQPALKQLTHAPASSHKLTKVEVPQLLN